MLFAAADRASHPAYKAIADVGRVAIACALVPVMAPDAVLSADSNFIYNRFAGDERIPHFALKAWRHSKRTPRSCHIIIVNTLIG